MGFGALAPTITKGVQKKERGRKRERVGDREEEKKGKRKERERRGSRKVGKNKEKSKLA